MEVWQPAYIAIGSNLEMPRDQVLGAFHQLGAIAGVWLALRSPLYGSWPLDRTDQPDYVNAVAGILSALEPLELLRALQALERSFGRPAARERWGPRILDLDLLIYGGERRADAELTLPHPGLADRNFVLFPLADIAPELDVPGLGRVRTLKARVDQEGIWRLPDAGGEGRAMTGTASHGGRAA